MVWQDLRYMVMAIVKSWPLIFFDLILVDVVPILLDYHDLSSFSFITRKIKFNMDWDFAYDIEVWVH